MATQKRAGNKQQTTHLQFYGKVPAVKASELKPGDVTVWNGGATEKIVDVTPSKSGKTLKATIEYTNMDGKKVMATRKLNSDRLVGIEVKPTATKKPSTIKPAAGKSKRELAREQKAEENIITTICGNTAPGERKVSVDWVALASGTRDAEKVKEIASKYGLKISDNNIDLSGKANMGKAYAEVLDKRRKELNDYLNRKEERKRMKAKDNALKKAKAQAAKNSKKSKGAKR